MLLALMAVGGGCIADGVRGHGPLCVFFAAVSRGANIRHDGSLVKTFARRSDGIYSSQSLMETQRDTSKTAVESPPPVPSSADRGDPRMHYGYAGRSDIEMTNRDV